MHYIAEVVSFFLNTDAGTPAQSSPIPAAERVPIVDADGAGEAPSSEAGAAVEIPKEEHKDPSAALDKLTEDDDKASCLVVPVECDTGVFQRKKGQCSSPITSKSRNGRFSRPSLFSKLGIV